jgi:hypothetical protein
VLIPCYKSKALEDFSLILLSRKDFGFSATIRADITKNYEVEHNMVAVMEGDVLILASTANFKVRKTCFLEENRSAVVGGLKRCA